MFTAAAALSEEEALATIRNNGGTRPTGGALDNPAAGIPAIAAAGFEVPEDPAGQIRAAEARAQAAPAAPRRPAPPTLDQRIGAIRQYQEQTGRLNPFQAKELERLQRQRRIEKRQAANAGVPGVPGAVETTTEVSQGVATRQVSQQTEQQTQQQAPQDAFATAVNNFGTYVDKLVNFEFPTIPDTITLQANHNVVVTFQGAAALEGLNDSMQQVAVRETDKALAKIWEQSNGQYGGIARAPAGGVGGAGNT